MQLLRDATANLLPSGVPCLHRGDSGCLRGRSPTARQWLARLPLSAHGPLSLPMRKVEKHPNRGWLQAQCKPVDSQSGRLCLLSSLAPLLVCQITFAWAGSTRCVGLAVAHAAFRQLKTGRSHTLSDSPSSSSLASPCFLQLAETLLRAEISGAIGKRTQSEKCLYISKQRPLATLDISNPV